MKTSKADSIPDLVRRIMEEGHKNSAPLPPATAKKVIVNFLSDIPATQKDPVNSVEPAPFSLTAPAIRPKN